jgi:hypothetical protein
MPLSRLLRPWTWTACAAFAAAAVLSAPSLRAADTSLTSAWRTTDVHVDGENTEWGTLTVLDDGPALGAMNDADALYVIATTSDQTLRQTLAQGVIVWLDATADKKKTFGIGIPGIVEPGGASARRLPPPTEGIILPEPATSIRQFDVYRSGEKTPHVVRLDPVLGIALAAIEDRGVLTYELKVPLARDATRPYAVGAVAGATIDVGVESIASAPPPSRSRGFGVGPMGPLGGRIGGVGSGGFGGAGFGNGRQEPLKYWVSLRLAGAGTR